MFYWKRTAIGYYEARRDGKIVATAERVKDNGAPVWELFVFDGTPLPKSSRGSTLRKFCTLGDCKFAYGYAYRKANAE